MEKIALIGKLWFALRLVRLANVCNAGWQFIFNRFYLIERVSFSMAHNVFQLYAGGDFHH
jgi:hypothetical protein